MRSIKLFAHRIADVYLEGQEMKKSSQEKDKAETKSTEEKSPALDDNDKSEVVVPA
jgi:ribosomal protein S2